MNTAKPTTGDVRSGSEPKPLLPTLENIAAIADFYEFSMAQANMHEGISGIPALFDVMIRDLPKTKVIGEFTQEGVTYPKLAQRNYLILAGTEQALAYLTQARIDPAFITYLKNVQGMTDERFLAQLADTKFMGDVFGIPEGTLVFAHEPWMQVRAPFEVAQYFESLLLNTLNPQTNIATTANDIAEVAQGKLLLEGGSRRAGAPQAALFASRAARIGGFSATSNTLFGQLHGEKVGGTHGHSYVMLHETEGAAFDAQAKLHGSQVTFLMDTYNVAHAAEKVIDLVRRHDLPTFNVRIDSGDLAAQSVMLRKRFTDAGLPSCRIIASDDLTASKIATIEVQGTVDAYLVGTYVTNPPKPLGGVMKLAAYQRADGNWIPTCKHAENPAKATLPGHKQVYRVTGPDGKYARDIIALTDEDIATLVDPAETIEQLTKQFIRSGELVADLPTIAEISERRQGQLARLPDAVRYGNARYPVIVSPGVYQAQQDVFARHTVPQDVERKEIE